MELTHSHVNGAHHLNRPFPEDMNILTHAPDTDGGWLCRDMGIKLKTGDISARFNAALPPTTASENVSLCALTLG